MCQLVKYLLLSLLLLGVSISSLAQIEGPVSGAWTLANSPYCLSGDVEVPVGTTLSIEAGVKVVSFGPYSITVNGSLQATGSDYQPIVFTSSVSENGWNGLRFIASSGNSLLSHCYVNKVLNTDPTIEGGAIYCSAPNLEIRNCRIENNYTASNGGGIYIANESNDATTITESIIQGNIADQRGGGIAMQGAYNVTIENCLIYKNEAVQTGGSAGAGMHISGPGNPTINHCTVYGNESFPDSGITVFLNATATISNCILWGNQGDDLTTFPTSGGLATTDFCNIGNGPMVGSNLISEYPDFVDEAADNYYLQGSSPCIDVGTNSTVSSDYLGNARTAGGTPDLGAYEYGYFNVELSAEFVGCEGSCDAWLDLNITGGAEPYNIVWSNGSDTLLCEGDQTVTVTDAGGQTISESIFLEYLYNLPVTEFTVNDSIQCLSGNLFEYENLTSIDCGEMEFLWFLGGFGPGSTSEEINPAYQYPMADVVGVSLNTVTNTGCASSNAMIVVVIDGLESNLELTACTGSTVEYEGEQLAIGGPYPFPYSSNDGCDSTVLVTVVESNTINITQNYTVCEGSTFDYNGSFLPAGSSTDFPFATASGCDSIVTVNVVGVNNVIDSLSFTTCPNIPYDLNGTLFNAGTTELNLMSANGCDSTVFVTVTELNNGSSSEQTYTTCTGVPYIYNGTPLNPNTETDFTFPSSSGCDSIITVIITEAPSFLEMDTVTTCTDTYIYNGIPLNANSTTEFNFLSITDCDSTIFITVIGAGSISSETTFTTCNGLPYDYNGTALNPGTETDFTYPSVSGCDSTATIIIETFDVFSDSLFVQTCAGIPYDYNGTMLMGNTTTDFSFLDSNGCDSTIVVIVSEQGIPQSDSITVQTCSGVPYNFDGTLLNPNTTTDINYASTSGCDSTVIVTVEEAGSILTESTFQTCTGVPYEFEGENLLPNSETDFTFPASNGCDSIVTIFIEELSALTGADTFATCTGVSYEFEGENLLPNSETDFIFPAANGCDSVVTIFIEELLASTDTLVFPTCGEEPYNYEGDLIALNESRSYQFYYNETGCDSFLLVVEIEGLETYDNSETFQTCAGEPYDFNGDLLLPDTETEYAYTSIDGCDSLVNIIIEAVDVYENTMIFETCFGEDYEFNGDFLSPNSETDYAYVAVNDCDSIVTISIVELPELKDSINVETCIGLAYEIGGMELPSNEYSQIMLSGNNGCDSLLTIFVEELDGYETTLELETCNVLVFEGVNIAIGDSELFTYSATDGCDSTVTVMAIAQATSNNEIELTTCINQTISFNNQDLAANTETEFVLTTLEGCDSIITVNVLGLPVFEDTLELQTCLGEFISFDNVLLSASETVTFSYSTATTCDSSITVIVSEYPETLLELGENQNIGLGSSFTLNAETNATGIYEINWTASPSIDFSCDDCLNPIISPETDVLIMANLSDANNCKISDELILSVNEPFLSFPTAFSPNNDGINEVFRPMYNETITSYKIEIYNRWGDLLYEGQDHVGGWTGLQANGDPAPIGVYLFVAEYQMQSDAQIQKVGGNITLIR